MGGLLNTAAAIEPNRGMAVNLQDQTSPLIGGRMHVDIETLTLATPTVVDTKTVTFVSHNLVVGDEVFLESRTSARFFEAHVTAVNGNTVTLSSPLDFAFPVQAVAKEIETNLATFDGSSSRKIAYISPPVGVKWDITTILTTIDSATEMNEGEFGSAGAALTNGCILRLVNGSYFNIKNVRANGDISEVSTRGGVYSSSGPPGASYHYWAMTQVAGQAALGVTVRMDGDQGDRLELLIQDDLTDTAKLIVRAMGHVVV